MPQAGIVPKLDGPQNKRITPGRDGNRGAIVRNLNLLKTLVMSSCSRTPASTSVKDALMAGDREEGQGDAGLMT